VRELAADVHLFELAPARADQFHHRPELVRRHLDHQRLERLLPSRRRSVAVMTCGLPTDSSYPSRRMFRSAPTGATRPRPRRRRRRSLRPADAQGDVPLQFLEQPLAELPAGDVLSLRGRRSGELLIVKIISSVGSSTVSRGRGGDARGGRSCRRSRRLPARPRRTTSPAVGLFDLDAAQVVERVELRDLALDVTPSS
jgi:hypothetical protein